MKFKTIAIPPLSAKDLGRLLSYTHWVMQALDVAIGEELTSNIVNTLLQDSTLNLHKTPDLIKMLESLITRINQFPIKMSLENGTFSFISKHEVPLNIEDEIYAGIQYEIEHNHLIFNATSETRIRAKRPPHGVKTSSSFPLLFRTTPYHSKLK